MTHFVACIIKFAASMAVCVSVALFVASDSDNDEDWITTPANPDGSYSKLKIVNDVYEEEKSFDANGKMIFRHYTDFQNRQNWVHYDPDTGDETLREVTR